MLSLGVVAASLSFLHPLIGNNFVTAPNGISFVWSPQAAALVDFGGEYDAGICAADGSYHRYTLRSGATPFILEWGRSGDSALGRVTAQQSTVITLDLRRSWPEVKTTYKSQQGGFVAQSDGHSAKFFSSPPPTSIKDAQVQISIGPGRPCTFSFGSTRPVSGSRINRFLDGTARRYAQISPSSSGEWGDFLGAIPRNLNNSRIYASDENWVAHTVSRGWAGGHANNEPYFCWDSFFNGALSCLDDPKTARQTVRAILSWQTADGLVPNFGHWAQGDGSRSSEDRSQPPVGSMCIWKMQQRWPDLAFLKEVYPRLLKWHYWWPKFRDGDHDGLLEWGSSKAGKQGALWETGWDDTPQYADSEMVGSTLDTDAVDLNSLWSMDAEYLARIADAVGDHVTAQALLQEHVKTNDLIRSRLWNPTLGIFCSRKWESKGGQFLTRLTPMNFYPLICGAATPKQAQSTLAVMTDPTRFWGQWALPTVAYNDAVWHDQGYWHGTVWAPVNFLVFQGVRRYASPQIQAEFAAKSVGIFMKNWTGNGWCGENFRSDTGEVMGDKHYTWGALMDLVGLESVCAIEPNGEVTLNGAQSVSLKMANVPIHGMRYSVETTPGDVKLLLNGKLIAEAIGKPKTITLKP